MILLQLISSRLPKWSNWLLPQLFFFVPNTTPKLCIIVLLIYDIDPHVCSKIIFYFHWPFTILILKGAIGTTLMLNFWFCQPTKKCLLSLTEKILLLLFWINSYKNDYTMPIILKILKIQATLRARAWP